MGRKAEEVDAKLDQLDAGIKTVKDETKARHITLEARVTHLEDTIRSAPGPQHQGDELPPRSRCVVVFGSWPLDTASTVITDEIRAMLPLHHIDYKEIYTPAPRHTIGKVKFKSAVDAWRFLDNKFNWPGKWTNIERTRSDSAKRRPILLALDALKRPSYASGSWLRSWSLRTRSTAPPRRSSSSATSKSRRARAT